jgi:hypothetical protein
LTGIWEKVFGKPANEVKQVEAAGDGVPLLDADKRANSSDLRKRAAVAEADGECTTGA